VIGVGGVGINAIAAARLAGAASIVAVDINAGKAEVATAYGATHFVKADDPDGLSQVRSLTQGRGVDSTIECTGRASAMTMAYEMTRPAGTVVIVGIAAVGASLAIPAIGFPGSKKRIVGSIYGGGVPERDILRVLSLYRQGRLDLDSQIGARIPLEQINDALAWLESGVLRRTIVTFD
jgi:Zn-dependent alcohol dehydrogenase